MILIAHRGNIDGPSDDLENRPEYIKKAIDLGYNVEVDVWYENNQLFLGHDGPQYKIEKEFLDNNLLWCHAKNTKALQEMFILGVHCFWHETDAHTITSKGYVWSYPGSTLTMDSICVMPETVKGVYSNHDFASCKGICSDYIKKYK